jgi:outer membrane biosynthesis protein TonB
MKPLRLKAVVLALGSALLVLTGCEHKKPVVIVPQQAPPTAAAEPSPTPEPPAEQPAEPQQEQAAPSDQTQAATQNKPKHIKKPSPRKPASSEKTTEARNTPQKVIIPAEKAQPTPGPGQISPGPTPGDAQSQTSTEQLLQSAENNLNGIKRTLNKDEEAMRAQVKEFIIQSRKAIGENDPARAHNLAVKARLLSDELVKQR